MRKGSYLKISSMFQQVVYCRIYGKSSKKGTTIKHIHLARVGRLKRICRLMQSHSMSQPKRSILVLQLLLLKAY